MTLICYEQRRFSDESIQNIEMANLIIDEYERMGYSLTLRQLYYQFVSKNLIPNTERSYKNLGTLIANARMAGLVSWTSIEDRTRQSNGWLIEEDEAEVLRDIQYGLALDYWARQNVYVEAWVEKEALKDVLSRPCERWRVRYMACKGYLSASEAWRAAQRFAEADNNGRRCVLLHLGDHDPSGIDMTRDNGDRIDQLSFGVNVDVRRLALNMDQIERYSPPPNPAKVTDSRAADYISRFGRESWELDALDPRVIDDLVSNEVQGLVDESIWEQTAAEEEERRTVLGMLHERWDDVSEFLTDDRS